MTTSSSLAPQNNGYGAISNGTSSAFKIIPSREERVKSCARAFFVSLMKPKYLFLAYTSIGTITGLALQEDAMLIYSAVGVVLSGGYLFLTRDREGEDPQRNPDNTCYL